MTTRDKMPPRRGALGKGISSLLGSIDADPAELAASASDGNKLRSADNRRSLENEVIRLEVDQIDPNPHQPRKIFDESALKELSASLKQDGLLQPIVVARGEKDGRYVIIAGERRWRASRLAGLESIPAIVKDGATDDMLRLALIENIQREELNIIEEAEAYASLIRDYGLTQEQCADRVGKERSTVANTLRLLALPREVQDDIMEARLTMGHGRALLSLEEKKLILRARDLVVKKGLSVRQTEQLCKTFKSRQNASEADALKASGVKDEADLNYVTESLRTYLHTKVRLSGNTSRGKIEISYFSAAELERILKVMGHQF